MPDKKANFDLMISLRYLLIYYSAWRSSLTQARCIDPLLRDAHLLNVSRWCLRQAACLDPGSEISDPTARIGDRERQKAAHISRANAGHSNMK